MRTMLILFLGVIMFTAAMFIPVQSRAASCYTFDMGQTEIQVISLVENTLQAGILLPETDVQQQQIRAAYPDGLIHNSLNIMLLRGNGVIALVDTGYARTIPALRSALQRAGIAPEEVTHVILTHVHGDHTGGLLQDGKPVFPGATILFSQKELSYWTDPALRAAAAEGTRKLFTTVDEIIRAYGDRVASFTPGVDLLAGLPGIQAIDESGHTPGHVGIMARADGRTFLFWSDLLHAFDVQTAFPAVSSSYDIDPVAAAHMRARLLQQARIEGWLVTGSHVPFVQPVRLDTQKTS